MYLVFDFLKGNKNEEKQKETTCSTFLGFRFAKFGYGTRLISSFQGIFQCQACFIPGRLNYSNLAEVDDCSCLSAANTTIRTQSDFKWTYQKHPYPIIFIGLAMFGTCLALGYFRLAQMIVDKRLPIMNMNFHQLLLSNPNRLPMEETICSAQRSNADGLLRAFFEEDKNYKQCTDANGVIITIDEFRKKIDKGLFILPKDFPTVSQAIVGSYNSRTKTKKALSYLFVLCLYC